MTKETAKELQKKHNMIILRDPITREVRGLYVDTPALIPDLDSLCDDNMGPYIMCQRVLMGDIYRYTLILPAAWFDLWGWVD